MEAPIQAVNETGLSVLYNISLSIPPTPKEGKPYTIAEEIKNCLLKK